MKYTYRQYQKEAEDAAIRDIFLNPLLVAPTGGGKTRIATRVCNRLGGRLLWIAHRKELIDQAAATLRHLNYRTTTIESGVVLDVTANAVVASIQSFQNVASIPRVSLIVIDEAHHGTSPSYKNLFQTRAPVIGLTATPFRMDGVGLGSVGFGKIIVAATPKQLIDEGVLIRPRVFACERPDVSDIRSAGSDFHRKQLHSIMDKPKLVGNIVDHWIRIAPGSRTVCFAVNVDHSKSIVAAFTRAGIPAEHLDGQTPKDTRQAILRRLATGQTRIVSNVEVLTEGFDLPKLTTAIIARPTKSLCLHLQMIGRVIRSAEGKIGAFVIDHAGNHHRHGTITRPLEYDLAGRVRTAATVAPLGLRTCPACWRLYPTTVGECPNCGEVWSNLSAGSPFRTIRERDGDLIEFEDTSFDYKRRVWEGIQNAPDARRLFRLRFKCEPVTLDGELINPDEADKKTKKRLFAIWEQLRGEVYAETRYQQIFGKRPFWLCRKFIAYKRKKRRRR